MLEAMLAALGVTKRKKTERIMRPVRFGHSLNPRPLCLVCCMPMKRNNPRQILKYHHECRKHRMVLAAETRNRIP